MVVKVSFLMVGDGGGVIFGGGEGVSFDGGWGWCGMLGGGGA